MNAIRATTLRAYLLAALLAGTVGATPGRAATPPKAAAATIDIEGFLQRHAEDWVGILEHPQVACLLASFVPPERLAALKQRMIRQQGKEWLAAKDSDGGFVFDGFFPGAACDRIILWLHHDGRVVGGQVECDDRFQAFTNDPALQRQPPQAVLAWLEQDTVAGRARPRIEWVVPVPTRRLPVPCTSSRQARTVELHEERLAGRRCDSEVAFDSRIAIVLPQDGTTAPMSRRGDGPLRDVPRHRLPYLIAGDLVQVAFTLDGCQCARFVGPGGTRVGWISERDLRPISVPDEWDARHVASRTALVEGLPPAGDFVGDWESRCASFAIVRSAGGGLTLTAWGGVSDGGPAVMASMSVAGRAAIVRAGDGDATDCQLVILRLNNALGVVENGSCGDRYCFFDGAFLPVTKPRLR